ncbi:hypothetical protein HMPREF3148_04255 [Corynebacterium sp. HMSC05D08]|uniref:hypothetical protein n=1 Tax=Corynebacterium TaxID=1716 RepID=UPI0008A2F079|nr:MULTISPECIES: hypothetical protein [Corynebacterium]OFT64093.1 hypothetical protein HMPREF3148_04255 [Corynebacterium sp. HMSC05D08]
MAINLASAYITIMPDTSKLAEGIKKSLRGLDADGKEAGKKLTDGMSNAMKGKGKDAGGDFGKEITDAMQRAVKGGGTEVGKALGKEVSKSLDGEAEKAGKSFGQKLSSAVGKAGSSVVDFSNKFRVHAGVALGGLTALGKGAADYAAEAEQSYGAVESIFGEHSAKINNLSKTAADSVGLSGREYREQASYMGAMLKNLGTPMEELGGKSADLVAMGADLAATFGGPTSDAVSALGAVLRGETDPIERYGISIKQADIKAKMAEMGLDGLTGEAEKQAQSQATLALLTEQSASAQGQFARETDTAAHKTQVAKAKLDDAKETIGTALLPVMALVTEAFAKVSEQVGKHPKLFLTLAGAVGTVAAAIVGISTMSSAVSALGGMAKIAAVAGKAMTGLKAAMAVLMGPVGLIVAGIAAVVAGLVLFFTKTETGRKIWASFTEALGKGWDWAVEKFKAGIEWVKTNFGPTFESVKEKAIGIWDGVTEKVSAVFGKIKEIVSGALDFWKTGDTTDYAAALGMNPDSPIFTFLQGFRDKLIEVKDFAVDAWGLMQEKWAEFTTGFGEFYQTWIQPVVDAFGTAFSVIAPVVSAAWDLLGSAVSTVWNGVIKPVFDAFMQVASVVFPAIAGVVETVVGAAFRIMGDVISEVWNGVIKPAWDVMRTVFGIVADILTGNFSNLGNRFSELGQNIRNLVAGVFTTAFNLLKSVVTNAINGAKAVIGLFKQAVINMVNIAKDKINSLVQGFQEMPGRIKAAFAGAGTWLLDAGRGIIRGLADGVRSAAGMVENAVRAVIPDKIERFVPGLHLGGVVPAFARGGVLPSVPGFTKNDRDPILGWSSEKKQPIARVEPGEFIVNRESTKKYLPLLAAINGGKLNGRQGDFGLPGYADGGIVNPDKLLKFAKGAAVDGYRASQPLEGAPYVWGGSNWGDCSGAMSQLAAVVSGAASPYTRKFATGSQGAWLSSNGFKSGLGSGPRFATGFFNGGPWGGHTAGTIFFDGGKRVNVEMGGGRGNGQIGGAAAGADDSQFTNRYYFPLKGADLGDDVNITSTSTDGVTVESEKYKNKQIDWGTAEGLFSEWEKKKNRREKLNRWNAGIFDTGGILKPGNIAINRSGRPERILNPTLTKAFESLAKAAPQLAKSMEKYVTFAEKQVGSAPGNIRAYLGSLSATDGLDLADRVGKLFGIDGIKSTFGGVADAWTGLEDAAIRQVDAADAVKQAEENVAKARAEGDAEAQAEAEKDLAKAHKTVGLAAAAAGQAQIEMALAIAELVVNIVKRVIEGINDIAQRILKAQAEAYNAIADSFAAIGKLADTVQNLRENVAGLMLDQTMAQIELAAAVRNVRIAQMDGVTAQLEGAKTLAEAQAAFDAQRKADMRLAAADYSDLSLAYDRFRFGMVGANKEAMDQMANWSDKSHALYSELLAAQVNQQLVEREAQKANLEAVYKHTLAALSLRDVTANLNVAAQKLAAAAGSAFGMDQIGATVGQRYAALMAEKAKLIANQANIKTWINPVNWFTTMPAAQRRIKQIESQLKQLEQMEEFKKLDQNALADMKKTVGQAGWMGFFGAGDQIEGMIKNSPLGDANRALEEIEFKNRLIDLKAAQDELRRKTEKSLAEIEHRKKLDPLETLIQSLKAEKDSHKTWAEYWRTDNEAVRKALADLAKHQADSAAELKKLSENREPIKLYGDTVSMDEVQRMLTDLGHRVERVENPPTSAAAVSEARR